MEVLEAAVAAIVKEGGKAAPAAQLRRQAAAGEAGGRVAQEAGTADGSKSFDEIVAKGTAIELIKTEEGRRLLAEIVDGRGEVALKRAVLNDVAVGLELIKTEEGRRLLAETKDGGGEPALIGILGNVFSDKELARELIKTDEGWELLAKTRNGSDGSSGLHVAARSVPPADEMYWDRITPKRWQLLNDTKDNGGRSAAKVLDETIDGYQRFCS